MPHLPINIAGSMAIKYGSEWAQDNIVHYVFILSLFMLNCVHPGESRRVQYGRVQHHKPHPHCEKKVSREGTSPPERIETRLSRRVREERIQH